MIFAVEGNIASGKSTLLKRLSELYPIVPEPLETWQDFHGYNVLKSVYDHTEEWLFKFQSLVVLTISQTHAKINPEVTTVCERSLDSVRNVFIKHAINNRMLNHFEASLLNEWVDFLKENLSVKPHRIIYLKATPEKCYARLVKRRRLEENGVTLDYLKDLSRLHDLWLTGASNVSFVDADQSEENVFHQCLEIIHGSR